MTHAGRAAAPGPTRLSYAVGRLGRVLLRALRTALAPHGLTVPEYTTLSVIASRRGLSNAQLARRALITPQSMNEVLKALEQQGYVRRTADPAHGRIMRTELTRAGARTLTACNRAVDALERRMLGDLEGAGADELRGRLLQLARVLEEEQAG